MLKKGDQITKDETTKTSSDTSINDYLRSNNINESHENISEENLNKTYNKTTNLNKSSSESINISFIYNEHEVTFENKMITEFDYTFTYNPDNACKKVLDLKEIAEINASVKKVEVYSEEMDLEQIRPIKATPYLEAFSHYLNKNEISSKNCNSKSSKKDLVKNVEKNSRKTLTLNEYKSMKSDADLINKEEEDLFDFAVTGSTIDLSKKDGQDLK